MNVKGLQLCFLTAATGDSYSISTESSRLSLTPLFSIFRFYPRPEQVACHPRFSTPRIFRLPMFRFPRCCSFTPPPPPVLFQRDLVLRPSFRVTRAKLLAPDSPSLPALQTHLRGLPWLARDGWRAARFSVRRRERSHGSRARCLGFFFFFASPPNSSSWVTDPQLEIASCFPLCDSKTPPLLLPLKKKKKGRRRGRPPFSGRRMFGGRPPGS